MDLGWKPSKPLPQVRSGAGGGSDGTDHGPVGGRASKKPTSRNMIFCECCGEGEARTQHRMVSVCDCAKKTEDKGYVHSRCFKKHLAGFEDDRRPTHCPRCKKKYRIRISFRWIMDASHLLSMKAMAHAFDFCILMVTFASTAFAFCLIDWKKELHSDVKLYLLFGVIGLLTPPG